MGKRDGSSPSSSSSVKEEAGLANGLGRLSSAHVAFDVRMELSVSAAVPCASPQASVGRMGRAVLAKVEAGPGSSRASVGRVGLAVLSSAGCCLVRAGAGPGWGGGPLEVILADLERDRCGRRDLCVSSDCLPLRVDG